MPSNDKRNSKSAGLRKSMGRLMLDLVERAILDTSAVTLGIRLDPETRQIHCEVSMTAVPKSRMAISLSQLVSYGSEFSPLMQSDAPAGMILNLKLASVVEPILGLPWNTNGRKPR